MEPISLGIGAASTLASMFMNSAAQSQVDDARNAVIQKNRGQQAALDAEAKGATDQSLGRFSNFGAGMDADASRLSDFYKTPITTPTTPNTIAALPASTNDYVNREIGTKGGIADAFVAHNADTLGKLRSFGDMFGNISRAQAGDTQKIGQLGSFKAGDTAVTNIALDNANRAGNTDAAIGNILGGLGKVGLTAGLSAKLAPAAGAAAVPVPQNNIFTTGATPFSNYGIG
jgi:hypothetical protein